MKTLYVFHHTDLDGMGVKFLGMQLAKNFKCKVKLLHATTARSMTLFLTTYKKLILIILEAF